MLWDAFMYGLLVPLQVPQTSNLGTTLLTCVLLAPSLLPFHGPILDNLWVGLFGLCVVLSSAAFSSLDMAVHLHLIVKCLLADWTFTSCISLALLSVLGYKLGIRLLSLGVFPFCLGHINLCLLGVIFFIQGAH